MLFVTNNATKSRKSYKTKFDKLGVEAHVVRVVLYFEVLETMTIMFTLCGVFRTRFMDLTLQQLFTSPLS